MWSLGRRLRIPRSDKAAPQHAKQIGPSRRSYEGKEIEEKKPERREKQEPKKALRRQREMRRESFNEAAAKEAK